MSLRSAPTVSSLVLLGLLLLIFVLLVAPIRGSNAPASHVSARAGVAIPSTTLITIPTTSSPSTLASGLSLGIDAQPHAICAFSENTCSAGVGVARVTLAAQAIGNGIVAWPDVQVAFVLETTMYDGVYDPTAGDPGADPCAAGGSGFTTGMPCEESNGIPFFIDHAQQIANAISATNPHSKVSFALVDYFATKDNYDDGDGDEYHVDIQNFVPSQYFGSEVKSTFQSKTLNGNYYYGDSDLSDNILHSSSITALYGTIIGSGLNWGNQTHHVIVWMGSTAPRDPSYLENYCVSPSSYTIFGFGGSCYPPTCEAQYSYQRDVSPNCEGWIRSQDGNVTHSIAALARTSPSCTNSIGGVCTVDTIDLWNGMTDPYAKDWPSGRTGGGPGGPIVQADVDKILEAGCDLAAATGGTWDGPAFFTCPDGQSGTLQYVAHGPYDKPNSNNPTLFDAMRLIGFGPVVQTQTASGTGKPLFQFVSFGNIVVAGSSLSVIQPAAACLRNGVTLKTCQLTPQISHLNGRVVLGWNWSTNATTNIMYVGDLWTASFNVVATGPPFATVPVDACVTPFCLAGGSTSLNGVYTWASYVPYTNNTIITESFPLGSIQVQFTPPPAGAPVPPPPPPPVPPPFAIPAPTALPVIQQVGIGNTIGLTNVSLQGVAAGFLGAGFMRVGMKNRPIALKVAAKSGVMVSKFDKEGMSKTTPLGRFE